MSTEDSVVSKVIAPLLFIMTLTRFSIMKEATNSSILNA